MWGERKEIHLLKEQVDLLKKILARLEPRLEGIQIHFSEKNNMAPGPINLIVGQSVVATVLGFDQNGAPFAVDFAKNPVSWNEDNTAVAVSNPNNDGTANVKAVGVGTSNLSASCGGFSDSAQVNVAAAPPTPVLSSIKIDFGQPV